MRNLILAVGASFLSISLTSTWGSLAFADQLQEQRGRLAGLAGDVGYHTGGLQERIEKGALLGSICFKFGEMGIASALFRTELNRAIEDGHVLSAEEVAAANDVIGLLYGASIIDPTTRRETTIESNFYWGCVHRDKLRARMRTGLDVFKIISQKASAFAQRVRPPGPSLTSGERR